MSQNAECQLTSLVRHYLFSGFFTRVIKRGAHQIVQAREYSLGLQARTYLKLSARVKGQRVRMLVFKITLLELPISSALMISSGINSLMCRCRRGRVNTKD